MKGRNSTDGTEAPLAGTVAGESRDCGPEKGAPTSIRLLNRLRALPEPGMRAAMLGRILHSIPIERAGAILCEIHDQSSRSPLHKDAWAAFALLVERQSLSEDFSSELYRYLVDQERRDVAHSLIRPVHNRTTPMRPLEPGGRRLTLGERKALARKPNRTLIERLAKDPDPSVIRILLKNPQIVERDVVRLAATKLANPKILREIAISTRWNRCMTVVRALLFNPATPLDTKIRLLPTLRRQDIAEIERHSPDRELAQAARSLLDGAKHDPETKNTDSQ